MTQPLARYLWVLWLLLAVQACTPSDPITVTNAWIRSPAPGMSVGAAYFDIVNRRGTEIALIGARSEVASAIEMHTTQYVGEMMQMRQLAAVQLPDGKPITFAPSGQHLMLLGFRDVTTPSIPVTLTFSDATELTVSFELRSATGGARE